jgi:hypothetical protein
MRVADDPMGGGVDEPEVPVHQLAEGFLGPVPRKRPQQFVIIHSDFVWEFPPGGETEHDFAFYSPESNRRDQAEIC